MQKRVSARVGPVGGVPDAEGRQKHRVEASEAHRPEEERGDGFLTSEQRQQLATLRVTENMLEALCE